MVNFMKLIFAGVKMGSTEFARTGDKNQDYLHFYLTSRMYDCSLNVGSKDTFYQVIKSPFQSIDVVTNSTYFQTFKCHKFVLGAASCVFETMLFGNFREATLGKDEPITLENVTPAAFVLAMR